MNKHLKALIYSFGTLIVLTFIFNTLNYINLITGTLFKIVKIIIPIISYFIAGFIMGKNSSKKGYLNGLSIGAIIVFIFLMISLIFKCSIGIKTIIFYLLYLISSIAGSMIGIMSKKEYTETDRNEDRWYR